jgi:prepilin-type N-terminal cleavage/methylation domain-containing protein
MMQKKIKIIKAGFTLLEVLLAVTILGIVLSMVYMILISTLQARDIIQSKSEVDRVANRIISIISSDLQSTYLYQLEDKSSFIGKKTGSGAEIHFVTNKDSLIYGSNTRSDLSEISYFLSRNPEERGSFYLVRREDFFVDNALIKGGQGIRLFDRIRNFTIRFHSSGSPPRMDWDNKKQKKLPSAVEIYFTIPEAPIGTPENVLKKNLQEFRSYIPILVSSEIPEIPWPKDDENKEKDKNKKDDDDSE